MSYTAAIIFALHCTCEIWEISSR